MSQTESTILLTGLKPCLLYHKNVTWFISYLDSTEILCATSLHTSSSYHQFLYVDGVSHRLLVCEIDNMRNIHINRESIPSNVTAVISDKESNTLISLNIPANNTNDHNSSITLKNSETLEVLMNVPLHLTEYPICGVAGPLYQLPQDQTPSSYIVIGTAFVLPDESEPSSGRLLIFRVVDNALQQVSEESLNGGCYSVDLLNGKIIAGVNNELCVYDFDPSSCSITRLCSEKSNICVTQVKVNRDDNTVAVGDILRSVSLYQCTISSLPGRQLAQLELIASDYSCKSVVSLERVVNDPASLIIGDAYGNIIFMIVGRESDLDRSNPQKSLKIKEWFHLNDQINKFVPVSLFRYETKRVTTPILALNDKEYSVSAIDFSMMFCTISGRIGAIGSIGDDEYTLLKAIEQSIENVMICVSC